MPPPPPTHHKHQAETVQQRTAPNSPPASDCFTPPGYLTPTGAGYQTSAPSSPEGSPPPRRRIPFPGEEALSRRMVEAGKGEASKNSTIWRPRTDASQERAVPPWADPNAQPPPPPSHAHAAFSPTSQRRYIKPASPTSSATEANPSPQHFNRPTPGSSPVMARRSLFRNNAASRAKSVDSLARSPPWADHKLRQTPRTDSPSRLPAKTKATSSTSIEKDSEFPVVLSSSRPHFMFKEPPAGEQRVQHFNHLQNVGDQSARSQALGQMSPVSRGDSDDPQQPSSTAGSTIVAPDSQPVSKTTSQEQSSPTPWRKNVSGKVAGANVTSTQHQTATSPCGPLPAASSAADSACHTTDPPVTLVSQPPQQAPWRRQAAPVDQQSQSLSSRPTPTAPGLTGQEAVGESGSQPSWRKQRPKVRPAPESEVSAVPVAGLTATDPSTSTVSAATCQPSPISTGGVTGTTTTTTTTAVQQAPVAPHVAASIASANVNIAAQTESKSTVHMQNITSHVGTIPIAKKTVATVPIADHPASFIPTASTHASVIPTTKPTAPVTKGEPTATTASLSDTSTSSPASVPTVPTATSQNLQKTRPPKTSHSVGEPTAPEALQRRSSPGKPSAKSRQGTACSPAHHPVPSHSPAPLAPKPPAELSSSEPDLSRVSTPPVVTDPSQLPLPPKGLEGALPQPTPNQSVVSFTPSPTMSIPTPPPEPIAKQLKAGGLTPTLQTASGEPQVNAASHLATSAQNNSAAATKTCDLPSLPPAADNNVISGSSIANPVLPPPPEEKTTTEFTSQQQVSDATTAGDENEDYVRESVTKRIKAFEKQASKEEEPPMTERLLPPARPVAPWVKKTSSGLVHDNTFWDVNSPEEVSDAPAPPPPPPPTPVHVERTTSPSRRPQTKVIPAAPPCPPPLRLSSVPKGSTQPAKVPRPRTQLPRQRSISTGDYRANYISPDEFTTSIKMPAEGVPNGVATEDPCFDPWCDPENPRTITFQDVSAAAFKIKSGIMNTPCTHSHLSSFVGMEIFFKKEFNQCTGSFKERGARYTLLMLTEEQQKKGVIAASAGNHALALSYHGQDLGIPVTVVMPLVAPIMKVQACRQYGANIIVKGQDIGECRELALRMSKEQGLLYINGYDHPHILAGQGTMGLEIVEQVPNIDAVVIPVGGGGLIAGVALAVKALYPHVKVIGVESERCASFSAAMKSGKPVYVKAESTLADGLAVPKVGVNAFATAAPLIDKIVTVKEEWIAISILRLVEGEKAVVEGAGATALAAILAGELNELQGKRVVIPLCGGNIDTTVLGRCLERGLAADGRLVKFTVTVSDRPGGIAELTRLLANLGVSIKDMVHERAWIRSDIFSVEVKVMAETRDHDHMLVLKAALEDRYDRLRFAMPAVIHEDS